MMHHVSHAVFVCSLVRLIEHELIIANAANGEEYEEYDHGND